MAPSEEERTFLAACVSAPADNGPRLIFGDWLQASGATEVDRQRGELMVVQCRLAEGGAPEKEAKKLRATEKKLAKPLEKELARRFAKHLGYAEGLADALLVRVDVERGFVTALEAPADVLKKLEAVFAEAPLLTELRLNGGIVTERPLEIDSVFFESPLLARVHRLGITALGNGDALMSVMAASHHLSNLRAISFNGTLHMGALGAEHFLTARGISALAASPHLAGLTSLTFDDDLLGTEGVQVIAAAPWRLESLSVANASADGRALDALARATTHDGLRRLCVRGSRGTDPAQIAALVSAPHLTNLVALDVEHCELGLPGLDRMLDAMNLPALEELVAASNQFGEKGAELIANTTKLSKLKTLDLTKNGFNKKGIIALAAGPGLAGIDKVLLNERDSDDARKALAESKSLAETTVYFRGKQLAKA